MENGKFQKVFAQKQLKRSFIILLSLYTMFGSNQWSRADTLVVTNLNDSGPGTLQQCIFQAQPGDTITFGIQGTIVITNRTLLIDKDLQISGPGANVLVVQGGLRAFTISSNVVVSISDLSIAGMDWGGVLNYGDLNLTRCVIDDCWADPQGGGLETYGIAALTDCIITNCSARSAGGIYSSGPLTLSGCAVRDCEVQFGGGGIDCSGPLFLRQCSISGNTAGGGAGIFAGPGPLVIDSCVITANVADDYYETAGGGVFYSGAGTFQMTNSTVSGNVLYSDNGFSRGAGIYALNANVQIESSTIVSNTVLSNYGFTWKTPSPRPGAGIFVSGFTSHNAIFGGNILSARGILQTTNIATDCSGLMISEGYNVIQDTNSCTITGNVAGNIYSQNPMLGPLQDNGGPTFTHALLPGSPAIDAGNAGSLTTDQRGIARPYDVPGVTNASDGSDIGAYEYRSGIFLEQRVSGILRLNFFGEPGQTNSVDATPNLNLPNWSSIATKVTDQGGFLFFEDPMTNSSRFYRITPE